MKKLVIAIALTSAIAAPAVAQNQSGLVNVNVTDVLTDLDLLNNSLNNNTVQVPIGVAANVCGITANVLAAQRKGGDTMTCTAKTTSNALKKAAKAQAKPAG